MQNRSTATQEGRQAPVSLLDKQLLTVFAITKILIVLAFIVFPQLFSDQQSISLQNRFYSDQKYQNGFSEGEKNLETIFLPFSNWDGQHYLSLADRGYTHGRNSSLAFFPLYPLLISLINPIVKNIYLSAFVLNLVLSYLFAYAYYAYSLHYMSRETAQKGLVLVLSYPTAFYLTAFYSEALFLLLLFGFLYYYDARRSYKSLVFALLMPLSRGQSVFAIVAVIIFLAIRMLKKEAINYKYEACNLFAFVLGGSLYLLFIYSVTGSPFSGLEIQKGFIFGNDISNIFNPLHFIDYLLTPYEYGSVFDYNYSLIDKLFVILFLLAMSITLVKPGKMLWVILFIALFYPVAAMGNGGSFTRLSLPVMAVLSLLIGEAYTMRKKMLYSIASVQFVMQLYLVYRFSLNRWVG
jgi:hypothetical protein